METLPILKDNFSFIRARDPSIISYNYCSVIDPRVRVNLCEELTNVESMDTIESTESIKEDNEHIKVYLRIKPNNNSKELYEIKNNILVCHVPEGSRLFRNCKEGDRILKKFYFSKIYGPNITQEKLFNDCIKEKVLRFINGNNSTLFTYGTSGSGKTFTILGEENNPGIIPRALEYIFRTLPHINDTEDTILVKPLPGDEIELLDKTASKQERIARNNILNASNSSMDKTIHSRTYRNMQQRLSQELAASLDEEYADLSLSIWVSFAEVYNEYVYDLLQSAPQRGRPRPKLSLGLDAKGKTFIKNLTSINVTSGLEAYEILQYGMHNLNYASTSINKHSSRSHCIFSIKLVQTSLSTSKAQISHFNFCDLAGAERSKSSCSTGDRLKESNNINTSLHVLGRCIKSIRESQRNNDKRLIPFRESKLTSLFQPALTGQESIAMIVNINPNQNVFDESQHVLNFSAITKDIVVEPASKPVEVTIKNRFSEYVETNKLPVISSISEYEEDVDLRQQVEILKELLKKSEVEKNQIELKVRSEFVSYFRKELESDRETYKENVKRIKRNLEEYHENKLQDFKMYYDGLLNNMKKNSQVVDLTKDDEIKELKLDIELKNEKINELKRKYNELSVTNNELCSVLNEAREDYIELKKKYKKARRDLETLKLELVEQNEEEFEK